MRILLPTLLLGCGLAACSAQNNTPLPAKPIDTSATISRASVGGAVLQTQTIPLASLNPATAKQYGIDNSQEGVLLLVTLRDSNGNALAPADLQLTATASVLPDPPAPLPLRAIQTAGMTDYIGVLHAHAPASVQFRVSAKRAGDSNDIVTTIDVQPH